MADSVDWLGYVNGGAKYAIYRSARLFVHPTVFDNNGMVAAEALCSGLPVVMYDLPPLRHVYTTGCVKVPRGDKERFAHEVAQICRDGFHMELCCFSAHHSAQEVREMGFTPLSLRELFASCDYVSLHCALTPETYHLIDRRCFEDCSPHLILINTARGGLVDEEALYEALTAGKIAAAGLDVFERQPPSPGNPLLSLENFLAGMHVAGSTHEALERVGKAVVDSVFDALGIDG